MICIFQKQLFRSYYATVYVINDDNEFEILCWYATSSFFKSIENNENVAWEIQNGDRHGILISYVRISNDYIKRFISCV